MRRAASLKTRILRLALAYALALQALLGISAATAVVAGHRFDAALSLCRALAADETQRDDTDANPGPHCVQMCLSAACGVADPPAALSVAVVFAPRVAAEVLLVAVTDGRRA